MQATLLIILFTGLTVTSAEAQPVIPDSASASGDTFNLQETVMRDRAQFMAWWYTWLAGYSAATAGQAAVFFTSENKTLKQDMALGAATTLVGAVGQLIMPMVPGDSPLKDYRFDADGISEDPEADIKAAQLLEAIALREKEGRSWKMHAMSCAVNLTSGLITWLGFKRTVMDGLENFALNTAITEAQIWTQPVRAMRDYERYVKMKEAGVSGYLTSPPAQWKASAYPGGLSLTVTF